MKAFKVIWHHPSSEMNKTVARQSRGRTRWSKRLVQGYLGIAKEMFQKEQNPKRRLVFYQGRQMIKTSKEKNKRI